MTTKPKISIIIPVYNVEKWLNKCIDSILSQSYENFEIILVNDGSTDKSKDICYQYLKEDNRVKVFDILNSGQSVARNIGLKEAKGDYILFIDSDDYISDNSIIEKFINILDSNNYDFIYTSYCRFEDGNEEKITEILPINLTNNEIKNKEGKDILVDLLNKNSFHHAPYLKVCRKEFILKNNLLFREGYYHEDAEWTFKVFYYAKKIFIYDKPWYMRRMRENSTITSRNEEAICKKLCDRLIIADDLIRFFKKKNESEVIINDLVRMYWGDVLCVAQLSDKKLINMCSQIIDKTRKNLLIVKDGKYNLFSILIKIFGFKNVVKVLKVII